MLFYEFDIPAALNGEQLKAELGCDEVYIRDNKLVIGGDLSKSKAQAAIEKHIPAPIAEPDFETKLASIGLSIDDLKAALGL